MAGFTETIKIVVQTVTGQASTDVKKFASSVKDADTAIGKLKAGISSAGQFLKNNLGVGLLAAGTAVVAFGQKAVAAFQDTALAAGELADSTGLTVEQASRWNEVAGDIGINAETLETAFGKLAKAIGSNPAKFEELGVSVIRAKDGTVDMNATILSAIDTLNRTPDAAKRAALGAQLFGKGWQSISELVVQGSDQITAALADVSDAKVITDDELDKAREFRSAMDDLSDAMEDVSITIGESLAPGVAKAATGFAKLLQAEPVQELLEGIGTAAEIAGEVLGNLSDWDGADPQAVASIQTLLDTLALLDGRTLDEYMEAVRKINSDVDFGPVNEQVIAAREAADKLGVSFDDLVRDGVKTEQGLRKAAQAAGGLPQPMEEAADATKDAAAAAREHAGALKEEADALLDRVGGARELADLNQELAEAIPEQIAAMEEANAAQHEAAAAYEEATKAGGKNKDLNEKAAEAVRKSTEANKSAVDQAVRVSDSLVKQAEAQAQANGRTVTSAQKMDIWNRSMVAAAWQAQGPLRQSILNFIATANQIPPEKLTEIKAAIDRGDLATAERLINETSRTREAAINADANTAQAERELNHVARDRTASIAVAVRGGRGSGIFGVAAQGGVMGQGQLQHFADGGVAMVGENGPEPVFLPDGSRVVTTQSARNWIQEAVRDAVATSPNVNLNINRARNDRELERAVIASLRGYKRRNGVVVNGSGW